MKGNDAHKLSSSRPGALYAPPVSSPGRPSHNTYQKEITMTKSHANGNDRRHPTRDKDSDSAGANVRLGGILGNLGNILEKLTDLAEAGKELSQTGELKGLDPQGKLRGVYGVSVKFGLGERGEHELKVEPFGNIHRTSSGKAVVDEVREPLVEIYEEDDHLLVLVEIPGVSKKHVQLDLEGSQLTINARRGEQRYRKEVALPGTFNPEKMAWDCKNGILHIRIERP
jgi:HSP20 family protein